MKKNIFIIVTSLLFISRFLLFISTQDVGIEHDSGWYLGVARNVAERGIYASYTNTISTTEKAGGFPSIHKRFSVQDKSGFIYFPAGVTVGPGYVFPEAFFLKMFGYGWVQYRVWPFIAFCLLVPILFYVILTVGSLFSLLFFQVWLWCYPQIFLLQSFESFSEHIALLFLFIGYALFQKWTLTPKKTIFILLSGLSFGISLQTKNVYILGVLFPIMWMAFQLKKEENIRSFVLFILFLALPTILFELYRFIALYSQFGFSGWLTNNSDIRQTWVSGGSGINILQNKIHLRFIYNKLAVWGSIGASPYLFVWPFVFISPFIHKRKSFLYWTLFISTLIFFLWFGVFSTTGWFRHILPGIVMGMIIISLSVEDATRELIKTKKLFLYFIAMVFIASIYSSFFLSLFSLPSYVLKKANLVTLFKTPSPNGLQGPQFAPIFSQKNQSGVSSYINKSVPKNIRVCFYEWSLVAEIPPLVDRVFFPFPRCRENDILILGPYQKNVFTNNNTDISPLIQKLCKKTIFNNSMYTACLIK